MTANEKRLLIARYEMQIVALKNKINLLEESLERKELRVYQTQERARDQRLDCIIVYG